MDSLWRSYAMNPMVCRLTDKWFLTYGDWHTGHRWLTWFDETGGLIREQEEGYQIHIGFAYADETLALLVETSYHVEEDYYDIVVHAFDSAGAHVSRDTIFSETLPVGEVMRRVKHCAENGELSSLALTSQSVGDETFWYARVIRHSVGGTFVGDRWEIEQALNNHLEVYALARAPWESGLFAVRHYDGSENTFWVYGFHSDGMSPSTMQIVTFVNSFERDMALTITDGTVAVNYAGNDLEHGGVYALGFPLEAVLSSDETAIAVPQLLSLAVFPNPFNASTNITFSLPTAGAVKLRVIDVMGREVKRLQDGMLNAGEHNVSFDAGDLPSGLYFARLVAGEQIKTAKILLIK